MPLLRQRVCARCGQSFELYEAAGKVSVFERNDDEMICPFEGCGEPVDTAKAVLSIKPVGISGYPRFDLGLGCQVESQSHWKRLMAERGLVCVDGAATSMAEQHQREQEAAAKHMADIKRDQDRAIEQCPETQRVLGRAMESELERRRKAREAAQAQDDRRQESRDRANHRRRR